MNMTTANESLPLCPVCRAGHLCPTTRTRVYAPRGTQVEVLLQTSLCDACGQETTRAAQHRQNLQALAARKSRYGDVLMGEEILAFRKRYGLTQQQASTIFGKGKIAFSRYESETSYPDESTTLLLCLAMEHPATLKRLADKARVQIPLWNERCEDDLGSTAPQTMAFASHTAQILVLDDYRTDQNASAYKPTIVHHYLSEAQACQ